MPLRFQFVMDILLAADHPTHRHICAYCISAARQYCLESTTVQLPKTTAEADEIFSVSRLCVANKCEILIGTRVTTFIDKQEHICGFLVLSLQDLTMALKFHFAMDYSLNFMDIYESRPTQICIKVHTSPSLDLGFTILTGLPSPARHGGRGSQHPAVSQSCNHPG